MCTLNDVFMYFCHMTTNCVFVRFKTKDICHVWELGGGLVFGDLLPVIVEKTKGRRLSVVLVLDLSKPDVLWSTMEAHLEEVKTRLENVHDTERNSNRIKVKNTEVCLNLFRITRLRNNVLLL